MPNIEMMKLTASTGGMLSCGKPPPAGVSAVPAIVVVGGALEYCPSPELAQ